jgi:hypothetical protein
VFYQSAALKAQDSAGSSNLQITDLQGSTNHQVQCEYVAYELWVLKIGYSLVLGDSYLVLRRSAPPGLNCAFFRAISTVTRRRHPPDHAYV